MSEDNRIKTVSGGNCFSANVSDVRDAPEKNATLIWVFPKPGLTPHGIFGALFCRLFFFYFWGIFCVIFHQKFKKKVPSNFLIPNLLGCKKGPQNFWIDVDVPKYLCIYVCIL